MFDVLSVERDYMASPLKLTHCKQKGPLSMVYSSHLGAVSVCSAD